ncbi:MAG: photosynthetic protein synthase I [Nitrospinae bacterium]|nr:photosynthetic protein synthase I [Nitrospinota bacterium]
MAAPPSWAGPPDIGPLPEIKYDEKKAALGKRLFSDPRLSGDAAISCASCHDPKEGFTKRAPLHIAYPGSDHFRNAPTLINTAHKGGKSGIPWHWDVRIGTSLNDMTRDMLTESYVMNMDMRIMQERLKQDPVYVQMFKDAWDGKEPANGRVRDSIPEFLKSLVSKNVPFDQGKLSSDAKAGMELFKGKAGCINCHNGVLFTDGKPHNTGVPENPEVFKNPARHLTYITFMFSLGVEDRFNWRRDIGYMTVSHDEKDLGKFITPGLRELKYTAPYMHNGMIATLDDVVEFYNQGGGEDRPGLKDGLMKPLGLSAAEKKSLVAFLLSLSGDDLAYEPEKPNLSYPAIPNWYEAKN